jgi:hypothetical protein
MFELGLADVNDVIKLHQCTDVACGTKQLLAQYTGNALTSTSFLARSGFMMVEFTSNDVGVGSGFRASWTSNTVAVRAPQLSDACLYTQDVSPSFLH